MQCYTMVYNVVLLHYTIKTKKNIATALYCYLYVQGGFFDAKE